MAGMRFASKYDVTIDHIDRVSAANHPRLVPELFEDGAPSPELRRALELHRDELTERLGRPVSRVAALADLLELTGQLDDPVLVSRAHYLDLESRSMVDGKTGLLNFAAFDERLRAELSRAERHEHQVALILVDVDGLKRLNDRRGHLAGDEALVRPAAVIRRTCRATDVCARFGGDEFAIIAPHADRKRAVLLATRLLVRARHALAGLGVGVSLGVADWPRSGHTPDELFEAADNGLYRSKRAGGNQVNVGALMRTSA